MLDQQQMFAALRRGLLVLFLVCSLAVAALAETKSSAVATGLSATTSGASTFITITGTQPMAYSVSRPDAQTILINLPGVDASRLARSYSVATPLVLNVTVEQEGERAPAQTLSRLRISLRAPAIARSQMADNNLVLVLSPEQLNAHASNSARSEVASTDALPPVVVKDAAEKASETKAQEPTQQNPQGQKKPNPGISPAANTQQQSSQGQQYGQQGFVGEPINLNVVNADIRDILNYITEQYGVNFVIDSSVGAVPVTVNVSDVPWNIALDAILRANRLGIDVNGNILRVATQDVLATEANTQKVIRDARLENSPLVTEFIRLNYARGADTLKDAAGPSSGFAGGNTSSSTTSVFPGTTTQGSASSGGAQSGGGGGDQGIIPIIRRRLSRRGSIEGDARSNTLIITDVKENIDSIRQLVTLLDQPEPQVEIETRIVIANRNFSRDLGVQLAAVALNSNRGALGSFKTLPGATGDPGPNPGGIPGGVTGTPQPASGGATLGANLANTVIGLTTGAIGTAQITAAITAAESKGQAKVVATPRVTALNNRPAEISSGQQIPVTTPQTGAGGTGGVLVFTTTFVSVPLRLEVTPQITDAGTVVLRVVAENNSVNTSIAVNGTPGIDTQRMKTEVLVPDGGTTVVGGVLADNESELQNRTPGIASIPVLGNLFKRRSVTRQTNEILFFITPRIYRPDYQGRPTASATGTGTRSTQIPQPVPLGNPPSNTSPPSQQELQSTPQGQMYGPANPNSTQPAPAANQRP
ncbi:MAG: type IV pilus secretin PilQ [Pyrinomonadaceae bacterium]